MALAMFSSALRGGSKSTIEVQLSKATDSGSIDVPKELFKGILEASQDAKSRRGIMMHIFECFTKSTNVKAKACQWRRIYAALLLTEELALHGSPDLPTEIAAGHHFDLLQHLSFLEHFEWVEDHRAQALVRSKAQSVRRVVVPILAMHDLGLSCPDSAQHKDDLASEDTASTCSAGEILVNFSAQGSSCCSDSTLSDGEESMKGFLKELQGQWLTKKGNKVIVNGTVATWATVQGKFITRGSLVVDGEFVYVSFPDNEEKHHAYLREEDQVLCWSDGDFWRRNQKGHISLQNEEWHGVLMPPQKSQSAGKKVIHGIVSVGHCSDTDTDSSAEESPAPGHKHGQRRMRTHRERSEKSSPTCVDLLS